jgi:hypothetical protein
VLRDIEELGAVENFIINEFKLSDTFNVDSMGEFVRDMKQALKRDPDLSDRTTGEILEKHGISKSVLNSAAWFMRKSERHLRSRSWLAHYVRGREVLHANGVNFEWDHPWLVQMANKGVTATQFLYNNASRPAFARTGLGRIFSRFQLFAWNSIKFRRNVIDQARKMGYHPDSQHTKRLKRMMTADLFVFGLASLVPASLFENAMSPPWNYFVDMADYLFDDPIEEDSEYSHFNNPLHNIVPPAGAILRDHPGGVKNLFEALTSGEWDKALSYQTMKMFPFGLLARDAIQSVQTPMRAVDNMTGFPATQLGTLQNNLFMEGDETGVAGVRVSS